MRCRWCALLTSESHRNTIKQLNTISPECRKQDSWNIALLGTVARFPRKPSSSYCLPQTGALALPDLLFRLTVSQVPLIIRTRCYHSPCAAVAENMPFWTASLLERWTQTLGQISKNYEKFTKNLISAVASKECGRGEGTHTRYTLTSCQTQEDYRYLASIFKWREFGIRKLKWAGTPISVNLVVKMDKHPRTARIRDPKFQ